MKRNIFRYITYLFVFGIFLGIIFQIFDGGSSFEWGEVIVAGLALAFFVPLAFFFCAIIWRVMKLIYKAYLKLDRWLDT